MLHAHSDARLQVFDRSDESREWNVMLDAPAALTPLQMRVASRHELGMALCPEGIAVRDGLVHIAAGEAGLQLFELPEE